MQRILIFLAALSLIALVHPLGGGWLAFSECAGLCENATKGLFCCRSTGFTDYRCIKGLVQCWAPSAY